MIQEMANFLKDGVSADSIVEEDIDGMFLIGRLSPSISPVLLFS